MITEKDERDFEISEVEKSYLRVHEMRQKLYRENKGKSAEEIKKAALDMGLILRI